jgi:hypothetical protein
MLTVGAGFVGFATLQAATLVDLDATGSPAGPMSQWQNTGTLGGDFILPLGATAPEVETQDGVNGARFYGPTGNDGRHMVGPDAPVGITGNGSRTVEAWIWNPDAQDDETIVSWGHRGGPDGSNSAFSHGTHPTWGAVGAWGPPDIGWKGTAKFRQWTYIVWTYDSAQNLSTVYTDGVEANEENPEPALNTHATDDSAVAIPFRIARQTEATGLPSTAAVGDITVAKIRVHDVALSAAEIQSKFDEEAPQFGVNDSDNDGMPNWFEDRYAFLDKANPDDADLDQDSDASSNLEEYQRSTEIDNPDTDGDGLLDGPETNTGTWVNSDDTGTNPLSPDEDGDGLLDGAETNTGTFVDASDAGTDPFVVDTDGDRWDDGGEVRAGSDPTDAGSVPSPRSWVEEIGNSAPKYWWRFEETNPTSASPNEGSASGYEAFYGPGVTAADLTVNGPYPTETGTGVELTGPAANNQTTKFVDIGGGAPDGNYWIPELTNDRPAATDKTTTVEYWIKTTMTGSTGNDRWTSPSVIGRESPGDGDMYWGWFNGEGEFRFSTSDNYDLRAADGDGVVYPVNDGNWHHVVLVKEWHVSVPCKSFMYIDGGSDEGGLTVWRETPAGDPSYQDTDGVIGYAGFTENGNGDNVQFIGSIDELLIYDRALTATEARLHFQAVFGGDTDKDGMPDAWETTNGLDPLVNDADLDKDSDGSTNINEYVSGTDPQNPDTDGDGLQDGVETGTGVWVSEDDRGTNPLSTDTDGDTLSDATESNSGVFVDASDPGSSPLMVDTDADQYSDPDEVELGTSPVDAGSTPTVPATWVEAVQADAPHYWYRFEGTTVGAGVPNEGSVAGFAGTFGPGILDADLGKASASSELGTAVEFTGPAADNATTKFVDFGAPIPELVNLRSAPQDGKTTTVEYWVKTSHWSSAGNNSWQSPAILARESPGDGDMYWGVVNGAGDFAFSTSDNRETVAPGLADGAWHHVVMTKIWNETEPSISRLFVDGGTLNGGQTYTAVTPAGAASQQDDDSAISYLGFTDSGELGNVQFIGEVDEMAIYNKPFNEAMARLHFLSSGLVIATDITIAAGVEEGTGNPVITWEAQAGVSYQVQRTTDLTSETWDVVDADNQTGSFTDADRPAGARALFYRVVR